MSLSPCVEGDWPKAPNGYRQKTITSETGRVCAKQHRYVFEQSNGPIPTGGCVLHSCDNPGCINLEHLRIGTQKDNMHDRLERKRWKGLTGEEAVCSLARLLVGETQQGVADHFGVHRQSISRLWNGRGRWA